jgi:hypothetical protein
MAVLSMFIFVLRIVGECLAFRRCRTRIHEKKYLKVFINNFANQQPRYGSNLNYHECFWLYSSLFNVFCDS